MQQGESAVSRNFIERPMPHCVNGLRPIGAKAITRENAEAVSFDHDDGTDVYDARDKKTGGPSCLSTKCLISGINTAWETYLAPKLSDFHCVIYRPTYRLPPPSSPPRRRLAFGIATAARENPACVCFQCDRRQNGEVPMGRQSGGSRRKSSLIARGIRIRPLSANAGALNFIALDIRSFLRRVARRVYQSPSRRIAA